MTRRLASPQFTAADGQPQLYSSQQDVTYRSASSARGMLGSNQPCWRSAIAFEGGGQAEEEGSSIEVQGGASDLQPTGVLRNDGAAASTPRK